MKNELMLLTLLDKVKSATLYIRLKPFEISSEIGRSRERYRRIILTTVFGVVSKIIGLFISLISVPLTVNYLGDERYGLWMTISSGISLLNFADLGLGNGLLSAISESRGKDEEKACKLYISSTFFILLLVAIIILILFSIINPFISWDKLFNLRTNLAIQESGLVICILMGGFLLNLPLGIIQRIQLGYQEGFYNYLWSILGNILGLIGVLLGIHFKAGLPLLVISIIAGPLVSTLFNWYFFYKKSNFELLPRISNFEWSTAKSMMKLGSLFFILNSLSLIILNSDNLIIARNLGASEVTNYAITAKLFSASQFVYFLIIPLWPAFGEAIARKDYKWAKRTLRNFIAISCLLCTLIGIPLVIFGNWIMQFWTQKVINVSMWLLAGFGIYIILNGYIGTMSTFLNQSHLLKNQIGFFTLTAASAVFLKIIFIQYFNIEGVIWANVISYGLFFVFPSAKLASRFFREHI